MRLDDAEREPFRDPIVEEIRRVREEHAARFGFDLDAIVADIRQREEKGPNEVVTLTPRRVPVTTKPGK